MPPRARGAQVATRIQRITAVWGETDRIATDPDLRILEPAIYLPPEGGLPHRVVAQARSSGDGHGPAHAIRPDGIEAAPEATYLLIDGMTGHYGHFIVDVLCRLWPLAHGTGAKVKLLCAPGEGRAFWARHPFLGEMLAGLDLDLDAVVGFDRPTRLSRVLIPDPSFRSLHGVHAVFGDLCRRIGRGCWTDAEVDTIARPAYLSKTRLGSGVQRLLNEAALVAVLERWGVDILFPETMSFAEQVRQFAMRRVVIGTTGSAFHTTAFSAPGRRTVALSGMLHLHANYMMFDAINGNRAAYYFTPGTVSSAEAGFGFGWTIPDPERVAEQVLRRAEEIHRIDEYDAQVEAEERRRGRSVAGRLRRLRRRMSDRWGGGRGPDP